MARTRAATDVQCFLSKNAFSLYQWLIFILCFLIVLMDGFDTAAIGFIAPSLITEWGIEKSALGPVLSAALFGLAFGALTAGPLALILSREFLLGTLMMWLAYFMGLVIVYGLVNWMPLLFKDAGIAPARAAVIAAIFQLGGVGAIFFALLMNRFNPNRIIGIGYFVTCIAVALIGQAVGGGEGLLVAAVALAGLIMNASQSSMQALAANFYPTAGRATGVSWMLGIGRFGGIAGSFVVAELARRHVPLPQVFVVVGIPGLIAAAALFIKDRFGCPQEAVPVQFAGAH